jgi:3-deoxy-D-manno-octulosonic-acid transferase
MPEVVMYFFYSLLLVVWGILLIPAFAYRAWRYRKRLPGLSQRLGRLPDTLKPDGRKTIWFHSCSVGETLSLQTLVRSLHESFPEIRLVFSTITATGQQVAVERFAEYGQGHAFYFPIDFAFISRRVLNWIQPAMLVIVDTEIWPNTVHQANLRGIPVVLVNGRISNSSFPYYHLARSIFRKVFKDYRILMMQSDEDANRILRIGAPAKKIVVTGNIKFDTAGMRTKENVADDLAKVFELGNYCGPLIVAGSTHPEEEQILLDVFRTIRRLPDLAETRLLLAPRHPERFEAVAQLAAGSGFKVRRRTEDVNGAQNPDVLLLDTLGELSAAYKLATLVFVGGTLTRRGGHSIMEPAQYSKAIVTGPYMENFGRVADEFRAGGAMRQITAGEEDKGLQVRQLVEVFSELLQNAEEREALGVAACAILERNRGAAHRVFQRIAEIYEETTMSKCPA